MCIYYIGGWIHAVYTPEDSLVFGKGRLTNVYTSYTSALYYIIYIHIFTICIISLDNALTHILAVDVYMFV